MSWFDEKKTKRQWKPFVVERRCDDGEAELGKTKMTIGELLRLGQGSLIELDKLTDQPLEIFVNNKLMAEGEVVVVNDKFGIRLINIISPGERVKELT